MAELASEEISSLRLEALARHPDGAVQRAVAGHPNASLAALLALVERHPDAVVANPAWAMMRLAEPGLYERLSRQGAQAIAGSESCPADFLRWAFEHRWPDHEKWLFEAVLGNRALDPQVRLRALFHFPQYALLSSDHRPLFEDLEEARDLYARMFERAPKGTPRWRPDVETLQRLIELGPLGARWVAAHTETPGDLLATLGDHWDRWIRLEVARHKHTPPEILARLAGDPDLDVQREACTHTNTPISVLGEHLDAGTLTLNMSGLLAQAEVPAEILLRIVALNDVSLTACALHHHSVPVAALRSWAESGERSARQAVAANRSTPSDVLERLASDENKWVREEVACNPNTPARVRLNIAKTAQASMRVAMAKSPKLSDELMALLAVDPSFQVRTSLSESPCATAEILALLSADEDERVRLKVARHVATAPAVIDRLRTDPRPKVAAQAEKRWKKVKPLVG